MEFVLYKGYPLYRFEIISLTINKIHRIFNERMQIKHRQFCLTQLSLNGKKLYILRVKTTRIMFPRTYERITKLGISLFQVSVLLR